MSLNSLRDRLERQQAQPEPPTSVRETRNGLVIAAPANVPVRDQNKFVAEVGKEPQLKPPEESRRHLGRTEHIIYNNSSPRDLLNRERYASEDRAEQRVTNPTGLAPDWQHQLEEQYARENAANEAARIREQQDRIAQQKREQDEREKMLAVDLTLASATPAEVVKVKQIVNRNYPADRFSPERHWIILQNLRNEFGPNAFEIGPRK